MVVLVKSAKNFFSFFYKIGINFCVNLEKYLNLNFNCTFLYKKLSNYNTLYYNTF